VYALPAEILSHCARLKPDFLTKGRYALSVKVALFRASASGLRKKQTVRLLLGLAGVQEWMLSENRDWEWKMANREADKIRKSGYSEDAAKNARKLITERYGKFLQTLLMAGFMSEASVDYVRKEDWVPLAPALQAILRQEKDRCRNMAPIARPVIFNSPKEMERVRLRFFRLKKKGYDMSAVQAAGAGCLKSVMALLPKGGLIRLPPKG